MLSKHEKDATNYKLDENKILAYLPDLDIEILSFHGYLLSREERKILHTNSPIIDMIKENNVDELQATMFQKNLNVNEEIDSCIAETDPHLYNCIPIYFAAYFGSIKSFKYLLNHTDEKFYPSLFKYAIIGGNYDIIYLA
ncbi:hypothetical protein TRFO_39429 [Tritrichomonas foetus]|uniref:DUF3447 domain-containing protein n=1 Tax=Tritrichomonas foetus TaxID=1144522 RepID=A0A1J4J506_9EUKA|nr:hypothetical protein TRFO_39429 [Tritrichomonas foetus]|eukprot:OHS94398.1 hypothetical protein TRFO_39429 [Tritrichomonas foetus]